MKEELDFLIEEAEKKEKYFKNYLRYAKEIKIEAEKILGRVDVYLFGSILKKEEIPQDIDVLIISPKLKTLEKKSKIRGKLLRKIGLDAPFEIHLINPQEYQNWYKFFIKEKIKI